MERPHCCRRQGSILTVVTGVLLRDSGAHLSAGTVLGLFYGGIVVAASGLVLVLWTLGDTRVPKLALAIVVGSLATSLVLVAGYFLTGQRAGVVFVCWSAARSRRRPGPPYVERPRS